MKYFITMRCIDRSPKENYIHTTMKSLIKSGLFESDIPFEFHLFDGKANSSTEYLDQYKSLKNLYVHKTENEITKNENWLRSVKFVDSIDCDYVIQLEDDLLFCKNWLESINEYIEKHKYLIRNNPMVSFYSAYKEIERRTIKKKDSWRQEYWKFYGTQCVLFKKDTALEVVNHIENGIKNFDTYPFKIRKRENAGGMKAACIDLWLQEWGTNTYSKKHFIISCPSFVQHIGIAENKHLHQSHFLGENWSYV